jgi:hypothetical protein
MKMSPWRSQGVLQAGVAVIERDAAVESFIDVNLGSSKAEALALLRDLEALAVPLHDVVVADHALMNEAADAVEVVRRRTPGGLHFARAAGEAAVVVGHENAQHGIGRVQIAGLSQTELAGETILEHAPESFDAALGLRTAGGDEGDAELFEGAAELSGLTFSGELFLDRPEVVVAHEDAAVIAVESQRRAVAAQQLAQQPEITERSFRRKKLSRENFAGGVVLQAERGKARAAAFEPVVRRAVELHQFALAGGAQTALAVNRSAALARGPETGLAQKPAQGFAAQGEALDLAKFFAEVVIVEAGIGGTGQANDVLANPGGQAAGAGPSAVGVRQSRLPLLPQTFLETFDLTDAEREQCGGSGARHVSLSAARNYAHSLQFLLTQRKCPSSHGVTFSRCC